MQLHFAEPSNLIDMIIQHSPIGIAVIDAEGKYVVVNPAYCHLYGYRRSDLIGHSFTMMFAEDRRLNILTRHQQFLKGEGELRGEWDVVRQDGSQLSVITESIRLVSDVGTPLRMVYVVDITERKAAEKKLQASESLFRALATSAPVGIFRTDNQGQCIYVNDRWCEISGLSPEQAFSVGWVNALHEDDRQHVVDLWAQATQQQFPFNAEYRFATPQGRITWVLGRAIAEKNNAGEVIGYLGTITDITQQKIFELELVGLATTDFLTGLANRRCFIAAIDKELARMRRHQEQAMTLLLRPATPEKPVGLLMIDLDYFKAINDNYGHAVGDLLLQHFAAIVKKELREIDMVGRVGGEEFSIILPGASLVDASVFAQRLCERIAREPLRHEQQSIPFTISVGATTLHCDDLNSDSVLARSDKALYAAKTSGRNCVVALD